jgi:CDP-diacylglycerol---glycerol-3-phosphate 3-phosphatidyltransferase
VDRLRQLPNVLTGARLLLAGVVTALLARRSPRTRLIAALFLAGSITDLLDGTLARAVGSASTFGRDLDPLADKLLVDGPLIVIARQGRFEPLAVTVLLLRDVLVTALRSRDGGAMTPSPAARAKTGLLYAGVFGLLASPSGSRLGQAARVSTLVAIALSVISALEYGRRR